MSPSTCDSTDVKRHAAGRGDVADAGGDARGQSVQEEFDGRRTTILTDEHGGMIGTVAELGLMRVFAARAGERFDARLAVRAAHPPVAGAKLELRECGVSLTALIVASRAGVFTPFRGSRGARGVEAIVADMICLLSTLRLRRLITRNRRP